MPARAPRKKVSSATTAARASFVERPSRALLASPASPTPRRGLPTALALAALLAAAGCGAADGAPTIQADGEHPEHSEKVLAAVKGGGVVIAGSTSVVAAPVPTPLVRYAGVRPPVHPRPPTPTGGPSAVAGPTSAGCPTPSPPTY